MRLIKNLKNSTLTLGIFVVLGCSSDSYIVSSEKQELGGFSEAAIVKDNEEKSHHYDSSKPWKYVNGGAITTTPGKLNGNAMCVFYSLAYALQYYNYPITPIALACSYGNYKGMTNIEIIEMMACNGVSLPQLTDILDFLPFSGAPLGGVNHIFYQTQDVLQWVKPQIDLNRPLIGVYNVPNGGHAVTIIAYDIAGPDHILYYEPFDGTLRDDFGYYPSFIGTASVY